MRYNPFGSGSIDLSGAVTSSFSRYAVSASYSERVYTASLAVNGSPGTMGVDGVCIYQTGPQGYQGVVGPQGTAGTISNVFSYP